MSPNNLQPALIKQFLQLHFVRRTGLYGDLCNHEKSDSAEFFHNEATFSPHSSQTEPCQTDANEIQGILFLKWLMLQ